MVFSGTDEYQKHQNFYALFLLSTYLGSDLPKVYSI